MAVDNWEDEPLQIGPEEEDQQRLDNYRRMQQEGRKRRGDQEQAYLESRRKIAGENLGPVKPNGASGGGYDGLPPFDLGNSIFTRSALTPGEDGNELRRILASLIRRYRPVDEVEDLSIERMAALYWRMARLQRIEGGAFLHHLHELATVDPNLRKRFPHVQWFFDESRRSRHSTILLTDWDVPRSSEHPDGVPDEVMEEALLGPEPPAPDDPEFDYRDSPAVPDRVLAWALSRDKSRLLETLAKHQTALERSLDREMKVFAMLRKSRLDDDDPAASPSGESRRRGSPEARKSASPPASRPSRRSPPAGPDGADESDAPLPESPETPPRKPPTRAGPKRSPVSKPS